MRNPTKIVMRHLPPDLTEAEFLEIIKPFVTPTSYIRFCSVEKSLGNYGTTRAYIDFPSIEELYQFKEKFDNYVFVDSKGNESYGLVEYAVNQKIPESFSNGKSRKSSSHKSDKRRLNTKLGSIFKDPDYLVFEKELEAAKQSGDLTSIASGDGTYVARGQALMEANLEEIKAREKDLESSHGVTSEKTPLLLFLEQKRNEKQLRRDEERRRLEERRKEIRSRPGDLVSTKRKEKIDREKNRGLDKDKSGRHSKRIVEERSSSGREKKEKYSSAYKDEERYASKFNNKSYKQPPASSRGKDENVKTKETDSTTEASAAIDSSSIKESVSDNSIASNKPPSKTTKSSRENKPAAKSYAKSRAATAIDDSTKERNRPGQEEYDDKTKKRPDSHYGHRTHYDYEDDYPRFGGRGRGRGGNRPPARSYDYDYGYDRRDRDYGDSYSGTRRWDYGDDHGDSYSSRGRGDRGRHKPTSYSSSRKDGGSSRGGR